MSRPRQRVEHNYGDGDESDGNEFTDDHDDYTSKRQRVAPRPDNYYGHDIPSSPESTSDEEVDESESGEKDDYTDLIEINDRDTMDVEEKIEKHEFLKWKHKLRDSPSSCTDKDVQFAIVTQLIELSVNVTNDKTIDKMKKHKCYRGSDLVDSEIDAIHTRIINHIRELTTFLIGRPFHGLDWDDPFVGLCGADYLYVLQLFISKMTQDSGISVDVLRDNLCNFRILTISWLFAYMNVYVMYVFPGRRSLVDIDDAGIDDIRALYVTSELYIHLNSLYQYYKGRACGLHELADNLLDDGLLENIHVQLTPGIPIPIIAEYDEVRNKYDLEFVHRVRPITRSNSNVIQKKSFMWSLDYWDKNICLTIEQFHWARTAHTVNINILRHNRTTTLSSELSFGLDGPMYTDEYSRRHSLSNLGVTRSEIPKYCRFRHCDLRREINNVYIVFQLNEIWTCFSVVTNEAKHLKDMQDSRYTPVEFPYSGSQLGAELTDMNKFLCDFESSLTTIVATTENLKLFRRYLDDFPTMLFSLIALFTWEHEKMFSNGYDYDNGGAWESDWMQESIPQYAEYLNHIMTMYDACDNLYRYLSNTIMFRRAHMLDTDSLRLFHVILSRDPKIKEYTIVRAKYDSEMRPIRVQDDARPAASDKDETSRGAPRARSPSRFLDRLKRSTAGYVIPDRRDTGDASETRVTTEKSTSREGKYVLARHRLPARLSQSREYSSLDDESIALKRNEDRPWNELLAELQRRQQHEDGRKLAMRKQQEHKTARLPPYAKPETKKKVELDAIMHKLHKMHANEQKELDAMIHELHKMHVNDPQDKPSMEKRDIDMAEMERKINALTVGGDRDHGHKKYIPPHLKRDTKDVYVPPSRRNNNMHGNDDRRPSDAEQHEYAPHSPRHAPPYRHPLYDVVAARI